MEEDIVHGHVVRNAHEKGVFEDSVFVEARIHRQVQLHRAVAAVNGLAENGVVARHGAR